MSEQTNIENNSDQLFQPQLKFAKNILLGEERPGFYTQLNFYLGNIIASIFLIWNAVSLLILKFPDYLREHKQIDVHAIIELRGRKLGFFEGDFFNKIMLLFTIGIVCWTVVLLCYFWIWRRKKTATLIALIAIGIYFGAHFVLLGIDYFNIDTTLFDKISIFIIVALNLIQYIILKRRSVDRLSEDINDHDNEPRK